MCGSSRFGSSRFGSSIRDGAPGGALCRISILGERNALDNRHILRIKLLETIAD